MTQIPLNLVFSSSVGFEHSLDGIKQTLLNKSRLVKSFSFNHLKVFIEYLDVSRAVLDTEYQNFVFLTLYFVAKSWFMIKKTFSSPLSSMLENIFS